MSALPEVIPFAIPKRPKVREKDAPPDQRKVCVLPFRAVADKKLTDGALRVLAAVCSYCNRAGLTWVSQAKLAKDLEVSQQAISKHMRVLVQLGYVEIVRKGFRGERSNTIRVIFDPTVDTDTAIAITSSQEPTRPPSMQDETPDPEGQRRIAAMIAKALKSPTKRKDATMPKSGETRTVRAIKEANKKGTRTRTYTTPEVVNGEEVIHSPESSPYTTSYTTSEVVQNTERTHIGKNIKDNDKNKLKIVNNNHEDITQACMGACTGAGMTQAQVRECAATLLPLFRAEGIEPTARTLADAILQLHRDTNR